MNQHSDIVDILNAVLDTLVKYKEAIGTLERKLGDTKSQKLVASTKNKIKDLKEEMEKFKESKAQPKSLIKLNVNPSKQGGWERGVVKRGLMTRPRSRVGMRAGMRKTTVVVRALRTMTRRMVG
jgi:hypothetical protein